MDYEKAYKNLKYSINQLREEVKEEYSQADDVLDELIDKIDELEKQFESKEDFINTLHNDMFKK